MFRRTLQLVLLVVASLTMLGAGSPATRFDKLGHTLMCPCGCSEILLECNHVGCPDSARMIQELHSQMTIASISDHAILGWFADKYGPTVLAAPIRGGFDNVAWIVPFAVLLLGGLGIVILLKVWKRRHADALPLGPAATPSAAEDALHDRIRRETNYGE